MIPSPIVTGLHVCHDLIIDEVTKEVTLTRIFYDLPSPIYPSVTRPFWAFASIHGPIGRGQLSVHILTLDGHDVIYAMNHPIEFKDRFSEAFLRLKFHRFRFPNAGRYEIMLWVDDEIIAQRTFHLTETEAQR